MNFIALVLTNCALVGLATAVAAQAPAGDQPELIVGARALDEAWIDTVGGQLERLLEQDDRPDPTAHIPTGIVQLRSTRMADGAPGDIRTMRSSGGARLRSNAAHVVGGLRDLPRIPPRFTTQNVMVNVVTADSEQQMRRLLSTLAGWERSRHAATPPGERMLALRMTAR